MTSVEEPNPAVQLAGTDACKPNGDEPQLPVSLFPTVTLKVTAVPAGTDGLCPGETVSVGFARTHGGGGCAPKTTLTNAPVASSDTVVMVTPAAGSVNIWPAINAASYHESVAGF